MFGIKLVVNLTLGTNLTFKNQNFTLFCFFFNLPPFSPTASGKNIQHVESFLASGEADKPSVRLKVIRPTLWVF